MKKISSLFVILIPIFLVGQNLVEKEGWELTFSDEFNNNKLDYNKWQDHYYWGGRFNEGGLNYYGTDQFKFSDSTLIIIAEEKEEKEGVAYTSGLIDCSKSFKQQYGYFEIRSKLPDSEGLLPAFWLVSTEKWPPEIDIYEIFTNEPHIICTNQHWSNKKEQHRMQPKNYKAKSSGADGFHIYAVEWTRKKMKWYYDNKRIKTSRRGMKNFIYKMHIIINSQLSDHNGMDPKNGVFPNYYEIDYVRVYKKKDSK